MMNITTYQSPMTMMIQESLGDHLEICRLLAAAVVNRGFCRTLLENPGKALEQGYYGEPFDLIKEERDLILSIRAQTLTEFAKAVLITFGERSQCFLSTPTQTCEC